MTNWSAYGPDYSPPSFSVDDQGLVHLRGAIKGGHDNVFTQLPRAIRPANTVTLVIYQAYGNQGSLILRPSGEAASNAGAGVADSIARDFTSLDGVTYWKR